MKNYGFNIELEKQHREETDWIFGGFSKPCLFAVPESERERYLPKGELQYAKDDMMDCVTRGFVNIAETKFTYAYQNNKMLEENKRWLEDHGYVRDGKVQFSDAYIAILSGTTKQGNSLKAPAQAIHEHGLVPKQLLPLEPWMTFEDYHNPERVTKQIKEIGGELKLRFPLNYELAWAIHFSELLKDDMVNVGGHAWPQPTSQGEYPKTTEPFNHVFALFKRPMAYAFDNYIDSVDGDYIKKLTPDYLYAEFGYRLFVSEERNGEQVKAYRRTVYKLFAEILNLMSELLAKIGTYGFTRVTTS